MSNVKTSAHLFPLGHSINLESPKNKAGIFYKRLKNSPSENQPFWNVTSVRRIYLTLPNPNPVGFGTKVLLGAGVANRLTVERQPVRALSTRLKQIQPSGIRKHQDAWKNQGLINFAIGEPDFETPRHIVDAAVRALNDGYTHYTHNAGIVELREKIADKLQRENRLNYLAEDILVTTGSTEALALVLLAILDPGDEVILLDPCYPGYVPTVLMAHGTPVLAKTNEGKGWEPDYDSLRMCFTQKTKAVLVNSPTNPTGTVYSGQVLRELSEFAKDHNLYVISDEVYEKFVYDHMPHCSIGSLGMEDRTFTLNSFSKTYAMTGWRIGYVACPRGISRALLTVHQNLAICAPSFAQYACIEALESSQECIDAMLKEYARRRALVSQRLSSVDGFGSATPRGTFYAFPSVKILAKEKGPSIRRYLQTKEQVPLSISEQISDFLFYKCNLITVAGSIFGGQGEDHVRVAFTRPQQELSEGLNRIAQAVTEI
jgi:aspartate/methionine/tyrosine aminotransferase